MGSTRHPHDKSDLIVDERNVGWRRLNKSSAYGSTDEVRWFIVWRRRMQKFDIGRHYHEHATPMYDSMCSIYLVDLMTLRGCNTGTGNPPSSKLSPTSDRCGDEQRVGVDVCRTFGSECRIFYIANCKECGSDHWMFASKMPEKGSGLEGTWIWLDFQNLGVDVDVAVGKGR